jgi:hypothetical protein
LEVLRRSFERIVKKGVQAGLVWGEELFFDATKVEANASLDSTRSRSLVEGRLEEHPVDVFPEDTPPTTKSTSGYSQASSWDLRAKKGKRSRKRTC